MSIIQATINIFSLITLETATVPSLKEQCTQCIKHLLNEQALRVLPNLLSLE